MLQLVCLWFAVCLKLSANQSSGHFSLLYFKMTNANEVRTWEILYVCTSSLVKATALLKIFQKLTFNGQSEMFAKVCRVCKSEEHAYLCAWTNWSSYSSNFTKDIITSYMRELHFILINSAWLSLINFTKKGSKNFKYVRAKL